MAVIREVMSESIVTVRPDDPLSEAVKTLCDHHLSGAPVVSSGGQVLGFISEFGLMDVLFDARARTAPVSEYMSYDVHVIHPEDSIAQAATMFALYGVRRLPVVENGTLLGVVTRRDLLRNTLYDAETFEEPLTTLLPAIERPW